MRNILPYQAIMINNNDSYNKKLYQYAMHDLKWLQLVIKLWDEELKILKIIKILNYLFIIWEIQKMFKKVGSKY